MLITYQGMAMLSIRTVHYLLIGLQGPVQSGLFAFLGRTEDWDWDWDWTDLNMEDWDWD